ncbi:MAG: endolytic transglycosylase MltG [Desulfovibrionales bacterium]
MRKRILFLALLMFFAAALVLAHQTYTFFTTPAQYPGEDVIIEVPAGGTFRGVAEQLEEKGVITSSWKFLLLGKLTEKDQGIKAGEFRLNSGWTPSEILRSLVAGRPVLYKVQLREGLTWWQSGEIIAATGLTDVESFAESIRDRTLLEAYNIPGDTAEGFLFPETYYLPRPKNQSARPVVETLLKGFWTQAAPLVWPDETPTSEEVMQLVIIASLVEKETSVPSERATVAGVYLNRIERGMLLQADPTIIYGLGTEFDGNLRRVHLNDPSNPYNTYQHKGLPPGPICSPGLASMLAVANPEQHNYLYFVAKGDGSHHFSKTLKEHNAAVYKYQIKPRK